MRWGIRLIGLVSTVILARLLTPEDFGLVAMATLLIGFIQGFSELGIQMYLIRKEVIADSDCNTAWTLQVGQYVLIFLFLIVFAPFAVRYFNEERLLDVIHIIAFSSLIMGFANIGLVLLRKELNFAKDFRFGIYHKLLAFFPTIILAAILRDYWALVYGQIISSIIFVVLSYIMHPFRPRFSITHAGEYIRFSLSLIPINIARFLREKSDVFVAGRFVSTSSLGGYHVASELASMVTKEIVGPVGRALFPTYAKLAGDKDKLCEAFLYVFTAITIVVVSFGLGLYIVAEDLIALLLGSQWMQITPLLKLLALYGILKTISRTLSGNILIVAGYEKRTAIAEWIEISIMVPAAIIGGYYWGLLGIVQSIIIASLATIPITVTILSRSLGLSVIKLGSAVFSPLVAGTTMVLLVPHFNLYFHSNIIALVLSVVTGSTLFIGVLLLVWWLRGKPQGVESLFVNMVVNKLKMRFFAN